MTVDFDFDPENHLCIYRISGQVTAKALLAAFARARDDARWSDNYNFLTLLDRASLADMTPEAMKTLQGDMSAADPVRSPQKRRAAIVCADELSRAMLAFWELSSASTLTTEERVFQSEPAARAWLAGA